MTTIASIISFVVLLLATSSFSAPLVPELQNATSVPQVENATGAFHFDNLIVLARREAAEERSVKDTVGLSSSSSEDDTSKTDQTTERLTPREAEDEDSFSSFSEDKAEREANDDVETLADDDDNSNNERSVTEETFSSETNTKRGIEVDTFETSTVDRTSVAPSSEVKTVKRSSGNNGWLAEEPNYEERAKRSSGSNGWLAEESNDEERAKRSSGSSGWLAEESNDDVQKRSIGDMKVSTVAHETSTVEDFSVPSSTKVIKTRDAMDEPSSFAAEENADFNERALGAIESSSVVPHVERDLQQSPSLSEEASEEFNRRAIGSLELEESSTIIAARIRSESTTDEQLSSSTEVIREGVSSTLESETTVTPVDDFTRSSPVSTTRKSKILAIIPGQISKGQLVINPATGKTAGFRPVHQVQLSQGQNQTVVEEKQPNY